MGSALLQVPKGVSAAPGELGLHISGDHRAPKAQAPGEGHVPLLHVKGKQGNNRVGNVLKLISEISVLWVSLNFWQKFTADFIPNLFPHFL